MDMFEEGILTEEEILQQNDESVTQCVCCGDVIEYGVDGYYILLNGNVSCASCHRLHNDDEYNDAAKFAAEVISSALDDGLFERVNGCILGSDPIPPEDIPGVVESLLDTSASTYGIYTGCTDGRRVTIIISCSD